MPRDLRSRHTESGGLPSVAPSPDVSDTKDCEEQAFPPGVAEWIGWAAARGWWIPRDFVWWLVNAPVPLAFEQCAALHLATRGWS